MMSKQRKLIFGVTVLYTILIVYFMFFAFSRGDSEADEYTFILLPDNFLKLPSPSELLHPTLMDMVSLGNMAAFIPFGILIPLLYRVSFARFVIGFLLSILLLETIQALTLLGSFDLGDVFKNLSGAVIGFAAYRIGIRAKTVWRSVISMGVSVALLLVVTWGIGAGIDKAVAKSPGPFVALSELKNSSGMTSNKNELLPFKIGGQEITPQFNVYDSNSKKSETYSYKFDGKEFYFYLKYGIPDQNDFQGSISVSVDGREILSYSSKYQKHQSELFEAYFEQADVLTITLDGNEKAWDVGYREMKHLWE
ncbi:VanZ family protein [Paenibacillus bovis]|uniref:Teicoplanin resistance protein VanZ n=1 Tax=Paenibacillus bovis TaxID=1616788 RepID=A0A172ZJI6_9BACL|nr:VanZ family protein [Paenibacillus bovis]ANF97806.1 teicoplanin resistance protein VanZ [Paenibacillus bovis]